MAFAKLLNDRFAHSSSLAVNNHDFHWIHLLCIHFYLIVTEERKKVNVIHNERRLSKMFGEKFERNRKIRLCGEV